MFGSSFGGSLFGSPPPGAQQQQQQQPQIPAHAALQAHMDASARNEEARVIQRMQTIHQAYTGAATSDDDKSHCFSTVLYNPVTPQQRQLQAAYTSMMVMTDGGSSGQLFAPPKPPQISEADWNRACVRNPDSQNFMPVAVVGAESLQARAILHQEQADTIAKHITKIQSAAEQLQQRQADVKRQLEAVAQKHQKQLARLLKVMKHVEVARCFNVPLQLAEMEAQSRILHLKRDIVEGQLMPAVSRLADPQLLLTTRTNNTLLAMHTDGSPQISQQQQKQWMTIMKEHRAALAKMTESIQKDQRDLQLIQDRVFATEIIAGRPTRI
jgi:Nucleoporin complex subunit 54